MSGVVHFPSSIRSISVAKAFFQAVTKPSDNVDDILPQEDGESRLSVYSLFSELFPEYVKDRISSLSNVQNASHGLTRLQFNKLGYEIYVKEQSRRVPSPHAKPGNPGYGFRQAKWRNTSEDINDRILMFEILTSVSIPSERCEAIRKRVEEFRKAWDLERRPCRCPGPGRPRNQKDTTANCMARTIAEQLEKYQEFDGNGDGGHTSSRVAFPSSSSMALEAGDQMRMQLFAHNIGGNIFRPSSSLRVTGTETEQGACWQPPAAARIGLQGQMCCGPSEAAPATLAWEPLAGAASGRQCGASPTRTEAHPGTSTAWTGRLLQPPHGSGAPAQPAHDAAERASKRAREGPQPAADAGLNKASLAHLLC
jgi:hypothetical protein